MCRCQVRRRGSDRGAGPGSRWASGARELGPRTQIRRPKRRCHLEVLCSCCELRRQAEMAGGQGPPPPNLESRVKLWVALEDNAAHGASPIAARCLGVADFGVGTRARLGDWGRARGGMRSEFEELPPEACSRLRAGTGREPGAAAEPTHHPPMQGGQVGVDFFQNALKSRLTVAPPAGPGGAECCLLGSTLFVDIRSHLLGFGLLKGPVGFCLRLQERFFLLCVPRRRESPLCYRVRLGSTWMSHRAFGTVYSVTVTSKVPFREAEW